MPKRWPLALLIVVVAIGSLGLLLGNRNTSSPTAGLKGEEEMTAPNLVPAWKSKEILVPSWQNLEGVAPFAVRQPAYIPSGLELARLGFYYFPSQEEPDNPPTGRNGIVMAQYFGKDGFLRVEQGWGIGLAAEEIPASVPHGMASVGSQAAVWIRGFWPATEPPPGRARPEASYVQLGWRPDPQGISGPGWKLSTDFLSLDELVQVAESMR